MKPKFSLPLAPALKKCCAVIFTGLLLPGVASAAPVYTPDYAAVSAVRAHWNSDAVVVELKDIDAANFNPAGCAVSQYFSTGHGNQRVRDLHHSMLISAYLSGAKVRLVISDTTCCAANSPLIIAVQYETK